MHKITNRHRTETQHKNGVIIPFLAVGFVVMIALLMFTVDISYMQMVRTELRVAADVAVKAGVVTLRETQDVDKSKAKVQEILRVNQVAGKALEISDENIAIGNSTQAEDGSWKFNDGKKPFNSIKLEVGFDEKSANGTVNLFFSRYFTNSTFSPRVTAIASNTQTEIILCLDRSHSMCWDLSGNDWQYPPKIMKKKDPYKYKPDKKESRWAALTEAVDTFIDVVQKQEPKPRVALITWGSLIDENTPEGAATGLYFPASTLETQLNENDKIKMKKIVVGKSDAPMLGGTEMSTGITTSVTELEQPYVNPLASRVIILMSDGKWTHGYEPIIAAQAARDKGIIIHTIGFLNEANSTDTLRLIAETTGGKYYPASNREELIAAFTELSIQLPVVLTE